MEIWWWCSTRNRPPSTTTEVISQRMGTLVIPETIGASFNLSQQPRRMLTWPYTTNQDQETPISLGSLGPSLHELRATPEKLIALRQVLSSGSWVHFGSHWLLRSRPSICSNAGLRRWREGHSVEASQGALARLGQARPCLRLWHRLWCRPWCRHRWRSLLLLSHAHSRSSLPALDWITA